ncbi:MAG: hypothetical protein K2L16_06505 [Muribaculaceae bacterium]|nr:hypothetical protein [Muribaculaceae bacterium]
MKTRHYVVAFALLSSPFAFCAGRAHGAGLMNSPFIMVLILLAVLAMVGHMFYILFFRKKLRIDWTPEEMSSLRASEGYPAYANEQEDDEVEDLIVAEVNTWEVFYDGSGDECTLPLRRSKVKSAAEAYERCVAMRPTSPEVVDDLNRLGDIVNDMRKRTFTASKTMLVVLWILVVLMGWGGNAWPQAITFGVIYTLLYSMASMKPDYVLIRKELEGRGESSMLTGIIAGLLGGIATAPTYRTVTKWSDGTTTTEDDNSATLFSIILAILISVFLVFILPAVSVVNYLRNYVFS